MWSISVTDGVQRNRLSVSGDRCSPVQKRVIGLDLFLIKCELSNGCLLCHGGHSSWPVGWGSLDRRLAVDCPVCPDALHLVRDDGPIMTGELDLSSGICGHVTLC